MVKTRLEKLQNSLKHPLLIKKKENLLYLTGYSFNDLADEYLLVTKGGAVGLGSGLERIDWINRTDQIWNIGKYLKGQKRLDVEYKFTYGEGAYLKKRLPGIKINAVPSPVDRQRVIKDAAEIKLVGESMRIVERVFGLVRKEMRRSAMTEAQLAEFIKTAGFRLGAEDVSFPPIVASGANAAVPHHVPSNKKLKTGESIILDLGFKYRGYCSDFTRTVFIKKADARLAVAYNAVEKAYNESISFMSLRGVPSASEARRGNPSSDARLLRPGQSPGVRNDTNVIAGDVHQKAVDVLKEKHLDKNFIHSLGHGTGLEIHESPSLSPGSPDLLEDGMVFSIEPGVYFPRVGGIRIEDLVYLELGEARKFINVSTKLEENIL